MFILGSKNSSYSCWVKKSASFNIVFLTSRNAFLNTAASNNVGCLLIAAPKMIPPAENAREATKGLDDISEVSCTRLFFEI